MRRLGWLAVLAVAGSILGVGGSFGVVRADSRPSASGKPGSADIFPEIQYYDGPGADPRYHRLDLYMPHGEKGVPVMLFLHGGSWKRGDKSYFGLNKNLALFCVAHHVGVALANYRLSPAVKHPEHIRDVARAFAWLHRHVARYGGDPSRLFVSGHSAGAHLAALLGTDESYLKAEGLGLANIRGVITLSAVFRIPDQNALFDHAFGTDPKVRRAASPTWQVTQWTDLAAVKKAPPFLVMYADDDFTSCGKEAATEFAHALRAKGRPVKVLEIPHRNHLTILIHASGEQDPAGKALIEFIHERCRERPPRAPATEKKHGT